MNQNRVKQEYWCHTCSKKIKPRADKKPEIICSECNGDFVEIMEQETTQQTNTNTNQQQNTNQQNTNQNTNNQRPQQPHHHHQIPFNLGELFGIPNIQVINLGQQNVEHNPLNGIQQFLQMLARNGNGGQNFFNFGGVPGNMNMGDYVFGNQQFDEILTRLMEQAKGGAPPASKDALKELKLHKVTQTEIDEKAECSVCKDEYELDEEVKVMPCNHMFHKDCLDPWLQLRNTCPVCRFELKSKKEKEEDKKKETTNNNQEDMDDEDDSHDEMGFPLNPNSNPPNNNYYI